MSSSATSESSVTTDQAASSDASAPRLVVLYDGECGFCSRSIQYIEKRDKREQFHYAPLQGEYAARVLEKQPEYQGVNTMLLVEEHEGGSWKVFDRTTAILRIFRQIGGLHRVLSWALIIPKFLRDIFYRLIAANRMRISRALGTCPMPSASLRARMLP